MDLRNIETFISVAELGSFTKTARRLGYSQSTVSFQIHQLEEELGTLLFERVNHTVKLTARGSEILAVAQHMMELSRNMEEIAGEKQNFSGKVRIAMADSLCHWLFWDHYEAFHCQYPEISVQVMTASTQEMFRMLNQNEADLVYTLDRHIYDSKYVIASERQVDAHFVVSPTHPLAQRDAIQVEELLGEAFILTEKGMSYRQLLEEELASRSMQIRPFLEIGDTLLICHLLEKNMGISFLPDYVTQRFVQKGSLQRLSVTDFSVGVWKQLLYRRDKWCTPQMQCVIEYL